MSAARKGKGKGRRSGKKAAEEPAASEASAAPIAGAGNRAIVFDEERRKQAVSVTQQTSVGPASAGSAGGTDGSPSALSSEEKEGIAVYNYVRAHKLQPALMAVLQECGCVNVLSQLPSELLTADAAPTAFQTSSEQEWQTFLKLCGVPAEAGGAQDDAEPRARKRKRDEPKKAELDLSAVKSFFIEQDTKILKAFDEFKVRLNNAMQGVGRLRPVAAKELPWRLAAMQKGFSVAREQLGTLATRMIVAEAMANNVDITPASAEAAANVPLPATRGRKWGSNAAASSTKKKSRPGPKIGGHKQHRQRTPLPKQATAVLKSWMFEHFTHPYPAEKDKQDLMRATGLTKEQVSNWFINARVRLWRPLMNTIREQEGDNQGDGTAATSGMSPVAPAVVVAAAAASSSFVPTGDTVRL